jgi:hypothetical protein
MNNGVQAIQDIAIHGAVSIFVAPWSSVSIGQSIKEFWGQVRAKSVTVHQRTTFWDVPFTGIHSQNTTVAAQ